jgi:hypothetical protein
VKYFSESILVKLLAGGDSTQNGIYFCGKISALTACHR